MPSEARLPFDLDPADNGPFDAAARRDAVDPTKNVVLEASAGTGKTRVLVERYVNLLRAGADPGHILAVTFTRKAAAEMRERIIGRLRDAGRESSLDTARWRELKDRLADIEVSTIDAFCLSLVREFPLEADVDPGFELADDREVPRLVRESLDQALRICRSVARTDEDVALVFAQLGEGRLRVGLTALLDRRLLAPQALRRYLDRGPLNVTAAMACRHAAEALRRLFLGVPEGARMFLEAGPINHRQFAMLADDIATLCASVDEARFDTRAGQAAFRALSDRLRGYFLKQDGEPRGPDFAGSGFSAGDCTSGEAWRRHRRSAGGLAPAVAEALGRFRRDMNVVLSRGVWRIFAVALSHYQRTLDSRALLDFPGVLERALALLRNMDEFAESRLWLESKYRHVLVDEFQDTSRAQWELLAELVRAWGHGSGPGDAALPPSIFIVGDRKQSIYGFRDADVSVVDEAARLVGALRPGDEPRRAISVSFRAVPVLLSFVNDLFGAIAAGDVSAHSDAFTYTASDRFPIDQDLARTLDGEDAALGLVLGATIRAAAEGVAGEIVRLLAGVTIRDRTTGERRRATASDIAILFRSRDSHREFEKALARRGISTYVYKGLGFFDADEIQDVVAIIRYLADPLSDLRAAAFLRSRAVRLSDAGVARLAPAIAEAILQGPAGPRSPALGDEDQEVIDRLRLAVPRWLSWVDRLSPSDLVAAILAETAYADQTRGAGRPQARENLKKLGGIIRRFQNNGYATMARVADHLGELAIGDESNAVLDARDSVALMTVHAAKGLESPIVFVVNVGRGTGNRRAPIRIASAGGGEPSVAIADYQSEADEDAERREREETKRLFYVALTRARDRLYLSAEVQGTACRMGRGSLGEVLPASMKALFVDAAACSGTAQWTGPEGRPHRFTVVKGDATNLPPAPPTGEPSLPPPAESRRRGPPNARASIRPDA